MPDCVGVPGCCATTFDSLSCPQCRPPGPSGTMIIRILAARAYVVILNGLYLADRRIRPGTVRVTFLIAESSGFPLAVLGSWRVLPAFSGSFQARALYHVEARPCASH